MGNNEKAKSLAKNTLLFTISSFGTKLLTFFLIPLYTSVLSTEDYGVADLISVTAAFLMYILTMDIKSSVLRFAIDKNNNQEGILLYGFKILFLGSALLAVGIGVIWALNIVKWEAYCFVFLWLTFFILALYDILSNYLRAIDKVAAIVVSGLIITGITIASNLLLLLVFKLGVLGYLISALLGNFIACIFCLIIIKPNLKNIKAKMCEPAIRKEMLKYSFPLVFNGIAWQINASLDKYFITAYCGTSENGIYSVASKIPMILTTVMTVFLQAWNLSAIKDFDKNDADGFFAKIYKSFNAILVLGCAALIFINIPVAKILFQKGFFGAWQYSSILLISSMFSALSSFLGGIFTAVKDSKTIAFSAVLSALVNTILNMLLIPRWGALGAAIATVVSFLAIWIVRIIFAYKHIFWKLNLWVDITCYLLLIGQVVLEHLEDHCYWGQACIVAIVLALNAKRILDSMKSILAVLKKKFVGGKSELQVDEQKETMNVSDGVKQESFKQLIEEDVNENSSNCSNEIK